MPHEIAAEAISRLNSKITDEIFLIIQNDRELMQRYLLAVEEHGRNTVNQQIGKIIKSSYQLTNAVERGHEPSCTLIQSHQIFE
jgi:hypothetical protein